IPITRADAGGEGAERDRAGVGDVIPVTSTDAGCEIPALNRSAVDDGVAVAAVDPTQGHAAAGRADIDRAEIADNVVVADLNAEGAVVDHIAHRDRGAA